MRCEMSEGLGNGGEAEECSAGKEQDQFLHSSVMHGSRSEPLSHMRYAGRQRGCGIRPTMVSSRQPRLCRRAQTSDVPYGGLSCSLA